MSGSDFGGAINLEGVVAAYVVARDPSMTNAPSAPQLANGSIADGLAAYVAAQPGRVPSGTGARRDFSR